MAEMTQAKAGKILQGSPRGIVSIPPSKSLAHRAIICAGLAVGQGVSVLDPIDDSLDILATLGGMSALGAHWYKEGSSLILPGRDESSAFPDAFTGAFPSPQTIDCGASASTLRFLLPLAALSPRTTIFTGEERLMDRSVAAYALALPQAGVSFRHEGRRIVVQGPLRSGIFTLPGNVSSQFVSGLLMALSLADSDSEIRLSSPLESRPYVTMTLATLAAFGIIAREIKADCFWIPGGQRYRPAAFSIEGDYSQAAYFLAAAALGCPVACANLSPHSLQGDRAILEILHDMGATNVADIRDTMDIITVKAGRDALSAVTVDARDIPDLVPPLAALCCYCRGTSRIINAGRLRLKESDRLHALASTLGKLGADIREDGNSLIITGREELQGGVTVDAHNDHRIAMAIAVAAIGCREPVFLTGAESVAKSYPDFWHHFEN